MSDFPIPDDLLNAIIALLPAKHACQCKTLSKDWLKSISKRKFVDKNYSIHFPEKKLLALSRSGALFAINQVNNDFIPLRIFDNLRFNKLGGSCDGMFVLGDNKGDIIVLNPLICQKMLTIPPFELALPHIASHRDYSIYKDGANGVYKVAVMSAWCLASTMSAAYTPGITLDVYSTATKSWRRCSRHELTDTPYLFHLASLIGCEVFFVHTTVECSEEKSSLIVYDVEQESVGVVETPSTLRPEFLRQALISDLNGKLCLLTGNPRALQLWIEYNRRGGSSCWRLIELGDLCSSFWSRPISLMRPNLLLFLDDTGRLSIYDADDRSRVFVVPIAPESRIREAGFYSESLIDPIEIPYDN